MVMRGKRQVLLCAFVLSVIAFLFLLVAFVTPYWFQSWPRVHNTFKKIGMWEACFAGLILERDMEQKAHHGCWWTLSKVYDDIRYWMMPWWFVITQIVTTLAIICEFLNLFVYIFVWFPNIISGNKNEAHKRPPIYAIRTATTVTVLTSIFKTATVILFGVAATIDRGWMPRPDLNYLSWSYGLYVCSAFFSVFASIAIVAYSRISMVEYMGMSSSRPTR